MYEGSTVVREHNGSYAVQIRPIQRNKSLKTYSQRAQKVLVRKLGPLCVTRFTDFGRRSRAVL